MPLKSNLSPIFVVMAFLIAPACNREEGSRDAGRDEFLAKVRELEQLVDPIEVGEYETALPAPTARHTLMDREPGAQFEGLEIPSAPEDVETQLKIYVFSIGQADSMLVVGPAPDQRTLLFDLGEVRGTARENYLHVATRILDITGEAHLDYLVVSHYHDDHTGDDNDGIAGLLDWVDPQFTVGTFFDVGTESEKFTADRRPTYERLRRNLDRWVDPQNGPVVRRVAPGFDPGQIDLGPGVTVEVLAASGRVHAGDKGALAVVADRFPGRYDRAPANENDLSIALEISFGDFEFFSGGDLNGYAEEDWNFVPVFTPRQFRRSDGSIKRETYTNVESHMVKHWQRMNRESDVEIYRANHHGSRYSTTSELLDALDPEFIIFSTGGGHGHPQSTIIERGSATAVLLATTRIASSSFSTWQQAQGRLVGEIVIVVNASGDYTVQSDPQSSFSDLEEADGADSL